jgi:hypothetical protein
MHRTPAPSPSYERAITWLVRNGQARPLSAGRSITPAAELVADLFAKTDARVVSDLARALSRELAAGSPSRPFQNPAGRNRRG